MPLYASPETHIAAGPWCFAGREDFFPDWEGKYRFAPEPLTQESGLAEASRAAQSLCLASIPGIARALSANHAGLPALYWQTLLMPWAIAVARQIVERSLRARAMIAAFGRSPMLVPLLRDEYDFDFADEMDFTMRGALGQTFNHWLFSRLLEAIWPDPWQRQYLPRQEIEKAPEQEAGFRARLRSLARGMLLKLPFPRLKGLTLGQAMAFSRALGHPCRSADKSADLDAYRRKLPEWNFPLDPLPIFLKALPRSLKALRHPGSISAASRPRVRVASVLAYEDAAYRQRLAIFRAAGNRLAYVQHGGNYGMVRVVCDIQLTEYCQDAFFTWGWKTHGGAQGNFIPLPYPQLEAVADKWRQQNDNLIFVGTEMPAFGYRLDSRPTPLQTVQYREDKQWFFEELGPALQARSLYRPYFRVPGTLADAEWILPRFPGVRLCIGPLMPQILSCRLLVMDHHGTTLLEAMAANAPVILYWSREAWPLSPEADAALDELRDAGIWFPTAEEAARQVRRIWADPAAFWRRGEVQKARRSFAGRYALTLRGEAALRAGPAAGSRINSGGINSRWVETLRKL